MSEEIRKNELSDEQLEEVSGAGEKARILPDIEKRYDETIPVIPIILTEEY